jgi:hypothetical protein
MKIADYGKAITSYIESPTRLQKQQSKKAAENFLLITGDRIQLADGTTPKAKPFTLDQFKEKANIYMAAYQSNSLPVNDIRLALDDFTKKGIADGTFTADEAIKVVKDLRSYYRDLAQKQRLRGVVEGIGTVDRSELVDGGLVKQGPNTGKYVLRYTQDGERLRKFFDTKEEFDKFVKIRQNLPKGGAIGDYTKKISKPSVKEIEIAELVYGNKYNKKGVELWQSLKRKERQGIRQGSTTGSTILKGKGPQPKAPNQLGKEEFIKLAKANKGKTFNEFLEVLKDYKTVRGADFTIEGIRDRLKMYDLGAGFFKREEPKGMSKEVDEKRFQKRKKMLETTAPFKAKGTGGFQFHHIMNIGGEIPLDTNDIAVISAKMNRTLSPYNRDLNNIANDITDLINEQPKGYLKKIDELNDKAEGIVKKAVKELPKEYRNLIGFNRVVPVLDEYGTPVNFVGKKFGGSDQKQPGIKLENLTKEQATDLRKRIKTDALSFEKVGLKDKILSTGGKILKTTGKVIKPVGYAFGANAVKSAITKADDMGIKLSLTDKIMAFDSGDADIAINNYMRRNDPEFAAAERAKDLAKMTDDFEEVGQTTFGKYNDQIKNIKLP